MCIFVKNRKIVIHGTFFKKILSIIVNISREVWWVLGEERTGQLLGHCIFFFCMFPFGVSGRTLKLLLQYQNCIIWEDWKCHLQNCSALTVDIGRLDGTAKDWTI